MGSYDEHTASPSLLLQNGDNSPSSLKLMTFRKETIYSVCFWFSETHENMQFLFVYLFIQLYVVYSNGAATVNCLMSKDWMAI
jgi:hypothetical protein